MKVRAKELSKQDKIETLDALYTAAGTVKGRNAAKQFLRDLLTESERIMLGRRILIARALLTGATYAEVMEQFKTGKDTVYKVARWLDDQVPGYEQVIADMEKEFEKREEKRLFATSALHRLKKRYPMHFLLFPSPKRGSVR